MISRIEGPVVSINEKFAVINAGGLGYKVYATPETLGRLSVGQNGVLWTHLAVREDALDLYGFFDSEELEFFEMLIGVSGIGPKGALGALSSASVQTLKKAIGSEDIAYLTKMSGIGKKTAEKIIIELRDKLKAHGGSENAKSLRSEDDVLEALKSLGYSQAEIREALKQIPEEMKDVSMRVKEALKILGKN